jgi:hypothetical protein
MIHGDSDLWWTTTNGTNTPLLESYLKTMRQPTTIDRSPPYVRDLTTKALLVTRHVHIIDDPTLLPARLAASDEMYKRFGQPPGQSGVHHKAVRDLYTSKPFADLDLSFVVSDPISGAPIELTAAVDDYGNPVYAREVHLRKEDDKRADIMINARTTGRAALHGDHLENYGLSEADALAAKQQRALEAERRLAREKRELAQRDKLAADALAAKQLAAKQQRALEAKRRLAREKRELAQRDKLAADALAAKKQCALEAERRLAGQKRELAQQEKLAAETLAAKQQRALEAERRLTGETRKLAQREKLAAGALAAKQQRALEADRRLAGEKRELAQRDKLAADAFAAKQQRALEAERRLAREKRELAQRICLEIRSRTKFFQ